MLREQGRRWLVAATAWCLTLPAIAQFNSDHYRFSLIASTGGGSFTSIADNLSINRAGTIAFVGTFGGAEEVYRLPIGAASFEKLTNVPNAIYGRAVQITGSVKEQGA